MVCAAFADAAFAAKKKPAPEPDTSMRFAIVRGTDSACEPACPEWIWAHGDIKPASVARLKSVLAKLDGRRLPVLISSNGGDVRSAITMGRMIRARKLDVVIANTWISGCLPTSPDCKPPERFGGAYPGRVSDMTAVCASACQMMMSGGVRRLAGDASLIGVHQLTRTVTKERVQYRTHYRIVKGKKRITRKEVVSRKNAGSYTTHQMDKATRRKLATYFEEMGVSATILAKIEETSAEGIHWLSSQDRAAYNATTSMDAPSSLVGPLVCKAVPAAANCRLLTTDDVAAVKRS